MLFVTIEDPSQKSMEVVVFNSVYEKTSPIWAENVPVIVQGKINIRDGETKMVCDAAKKIGG